MGGLLPLATASKNGLESKASFARHCDYTSTIYSSAGTVPMLNGNATAIYKIANLKNQKTHLDSFNGIFLVKSGTSAIFYAFSIYNRKANDKLSQGGYLTLLTRNTPDNADYYCKLYYKRTNDDLSIYMRLTAYVQIEFAFLTPVFLQDQKLIFEKQSSASAEELELTEIPLQLS